MIGIAPASMYGASPDVGSATGNMVYSAEASSFSCYGAGYEAKNAIDGDVSTRWASAGLSGNVWVTLDLKSYKTFNCVNVLETDEYKGRIEKIVVSVSDNGIDWKRWMSRRPSDAQTVLAGDPVKARYVQVSFLDCSPEGINVDEIGIFNTPDAVSTPEPVEWRKGDANWIKQQPSHEASVYQRRKAHLKYGMFIHYGINTFLGQEWTDGSAPASAYNPDLERLDPESWVKAAYEGGMNFVVLVTKHHDGFALWNTEVGSYNINHTGREGDKRDIVKEVSDACRKYGIKLGLYYSAWDRNWDRNNTQEGTGLDRVKLAQRYNDFALAQVTELMDGRYGEISEFWIDGAWVKSNTAWEFARLYDTVKRLQPTCQMAINCTIQGKTPDQCVGGEEIYYFPSDFRLQDPMFTRPGADADPKIYKHDGEDYYLPFEATICINNSWFWTENNNAESVLSADKIKEAYNHMVEQGNTLVLNLAPGKDGRFNDFDVEGLYAGARALGIARGDARTDAVEGELAVRVDYVTTEGYVASPTCYIYGKAGEPFTVEPVDLRQYGYKLVDGQTAVEGIFGESDRIEFVYEDLGDAAASIHSLPAEQWLTVEDDALVVSNAGNGSLEMYSIDGRCELHRKLDAGICRIDLSDCPEGVHIVVLRNNNGTKVQKILK